MATKTFTSPGGALWSNAASWSGGTLPVAGDVCIVADGSTLVLSGTMPSPSGGDGSGAIKLPGPS